MNDSISKYLSAIGTRGGQAATGAKKRRSPEHYARLSAAGVAARLAKKSRKKSVQNEKQ